VNANSTSASTDFDSETIREIVTRASSVTYPVWWSRVERTGFCAHPIHLVRSNETGSEKVLLRCKNRRASVCPSCSALYAGDTWHLVHAGLAGGRTVPASIAEHPCVFVTLTAPGYGPVHTRRSDGRCHPRRAPICQHGQRQTCPISHDDTDPLLGQPLCTDCYDYTRHALFTWHAPELWSRFTLQLRRQLAQQFGKGFKVSFVKIMEMQRRGLPHFHAVIRIDEQSSDQMSTSGLSAMSPHHLARLIASAVAKVELAVAGIGGEVVTLRFGTQVNIQPLLNGDPIERRRLAGYLAKYVTKYVAEVVLASNRIHPSAIDQLDASNHIKLLLHAIAMLSLETERECMADWLHTLGYRGHTTTKSRRYSTTMTELRAIRREHELAGIPERESHGFEEWTFQFAGHATRGDRILAITAAQKKQTEMWARRQLTDSRDGSNHG